MVTRHKRSGSGPKAKKGGRDPTILDVTVRDGSYSVDYQYSPEQVASISGALDEAGIDLIEVGHGCGLGAGENLELPARASDAEYVAAAKSAVKRAKIGVIAGPKPVTQTRDIDSIIDSVDFIRFFSSCQNPTAAAKHITYAKGLRPDLTVLFQMTHSSRMPAARLASAARRVEDMGVDTIYLVDTVGFFTPKDVSELIGLFKLRLKIKVGFHGHNNLGLAVANTLAAVDAGADSIDASLRGIGRAGGNAQLEAVVSLLKRRGRAMGVDLNRLLVAGQELIAPMMPQTCGIGALDVLTADANIALYPAQVYEEIAAAAGVGFAEFIRALGSDKAMVEAGPAEIRRAIRKLGGDEDAAVRSLSPGPRR